MRTGALVVALLLASVALTIANVIPPEASVNIRERRDDNKSGKDVKSEMGYLS